MRAALGLQVAIRVRTFDGEGRAAETRLVAGRGFEELRLESAPFRPPQVHTYEHLRPVRRVGPSDARGDREDGAPLVVRPGKLGLEARAGDLFRQLRGVV